MRNLAELRDTYSAEKAGEFASLAKLLMARAGGLDWQNARAPDRAKAAVAGTTSSDVSATTALQSLSAAFLSSLARYSAFDRIAAASPRVPVDGGSGIRYVTSVLTGDVVGEAVAKPLRSVAISAAAITKRKAACQLVLTREALRDGGTDTERLISQELRAGVTAVTDAEFLSAMSAGATSVPVGTSILSDLQALADALSPGADSELFMVISSATGRRLALVEDTTGARAFGELGIHGGNLAGIEVVVSDHLPVAGAPPTPLVMMLDAQQLVLAAGDIQLRAAEHAAIQMDSAPTMDGSTGTGGEAVSLWQANLIALMAERRFGFVRVRPTAVAVMATSW